MSQIRTQMVALKNGRVIAGTIPPGTDLLSGTSKVCQDITMSKDRDNEKEVPVIKFCTA